MILALSSGTSKQAGGIIATAIERDLTLLTKDSEIIKYEVKTIWQSQKEEK